jgi:hypothetical protein
MIRPRSIPLLAATLLCCATLACSEKPSTPPMQSSPSQVAKVRVYADGRLTLDGAPASTESLTAAFAALKAKNGVVWYYREQGESPQPPAIAKSVLDAIIAAKLPVSLSTKEDFSDAVKPGGKTEPRK